MLSIEDNSSPPREIIMPIHRLTSVLMALIVSGCAVVQPAKPELDHSVHSQPGSALASAETQTASMDTGSAQVFERQMKAMQEMHLKMKAAKTPAEREALMSEHQSLMKAGMSVISALGGVGTMGSPADQGPQVRRGSPPSPSTPAGTTAAPRAGGSGMQGMAGMMNMHQQMEKRMAMMEQMMQMLIDRDAATPSK
jgi:hypothetical protein